MGGVALLLGEELAEGGEAGDYYCCGVDVSRRGWDNVSLQKTKTKNNDEGSILADWPGWLDDLPIVFSMPFQK